MKKKLQFGPDAGKVDPIIWGAWGALFGGIAGVIATIAGAMPETQSIGGLVAGGFLMPFAAACIRNWVADRR